MRLVMDHEAAQGRQVYDMSAKNLGYDITSLDLASGELRLIEVKGLGASIGTVLLTPNERRVAEGAFPQVEDDVLGWLATALMIAASVGMVVAR